MSSFSVEDIAHIQHILRAYKAQVRVIVASHKAKVKKAIEEIDRRKAHKLSETVT